MTQTPSITNMPVRKTPPGNPLFRPIKYNTSQTQPDSTVCLRLLSRNHHQRHDHCMHFATASRDHPVTRQISDKSAVIDIGSFVLATIYDMI